MLKRLFVFSCVIVLLLSVSVLAAPQKVISFQGKITKMNGNPETGNKDLIFRLYTAPTGGTLLWEEHDNGVPLDGAGQFSVNLGEGTSLDIDLNQPIYIEVEYNTLKFTPRQKFTYVPYSMYAITAESVVGGGNYVSKLGDTITTGPLTVESGIRLGGEYRATWPSGGGSTPTLDAVLASGNTSSKNATIGNLYLDSGDNREIKVSSATGDGKALSVLAGDAGSGNGGGLTMRAGDAAGGSGTGGGLSLRAGNGAGPLSGGTVSITGGNAGSSNGAQLSFDSAVPTVHGGNVTLNGGDGQPNGGHLTLSGGNANNVSGRVTIKSGNVGANAGGTIYLSNSVASGLDDQGPNVYIYGGTMTSYPNGNVILAFTDPDNGFVPRGNVGVGTAEPTSMLTVIGTIETKGTGGIKFPDGTLQTTSASGGSSYLKSDGSVPLTDRWDAGNHQVSIGNVTLNFNESGNIQLDRQGGSLKLWSPGGDPGDTNLYSSVQGSNIALSTDNYLYVGGNIIANQGIKLGGVTKTAWPSGGLTQETDTLDSVIARNGVSTRDATVGNLYLDNSDNRVIKVPVSDSSFGKNLTIEAGSSTSTMGGHLYIKAGIGNSNNGGNIFLDSGDNNITKGAKLFLEGGIQTNPMRGGAVTLEGGAGVDGGNVTLRGGRGDYEGGKVTLSGGIGGPIKLGGNVIIYGGSGGTGDGNVLLAHTGSATRGNVGIGTSSPSSRLTVAGTVDATAYYLNGAPMPSGGVTDVTASSPLSSSGGATPNITIDTNPTFNNLILTGNITMPAQFFIGAGNHGEVEPGDILIGNAAKSGGAGSFNTAIGNSAQSSAANSLAIGNNASAVGASGSIAIGKSAYSEGGIAVGTSATAKYPYCISIGENTFSYGTNPSVAIGYNARASQEGDTAIGLNANAEKASAIAIGRSAKATEYYSSALGPNATASKQYSIALGYLATTESDYEIALGTASHSVKVRGTLEANGDVKITAGKGSGKVLTSDDNGLATWQTPSGGSTPTLDAVLASGNTSARDMSVNNITLTGNITMPAQFFIGAGNHGTLGSNSILIGSGANQLGGTDGIAFGNSAVCDSSQAVAIGKSARATASAIAIGTSAFANYNFAISIGHGSYSRGSSYPSIAIGYNASGDADGGVAIGADAHVLGYRGTAIGRGAHALKDYSVAIGHMANAPKLQSVAIGRNATTESDYEIALGTATENVIIRGMANIGAATTPTATLEVNGNVKIVDGTQGPNKVLTSDNNGLASWQTPAAGGSTPTLDAVLAAGNTSARDASIANLVLTGNITMPASFFIGAGDHGSLGPGQDNFAIGKDAKASGGNGIAIGNSTDISGNAGDAMAIGFSAQAKLDHNMAIGSYAKANGPGMYAAAIGRDASAPHEYSVALGYGATTESSNEIALGTSARKVVIRGTLAVGTKEAQNAQLDVNGNIRIRGTGTALPDVSTPSVGATYRGVMYLLQGSGIEPDKLYMCMMKSDQTNYQWVLIARGD